MIKKGRGIAATWYGTGYGNGFPDVSVAEVELTPEGELILRVGAAEVGQGARTIMPQICAEAIGVSAEEITILSESTEDCEDSGTAAATRQTYNTGNAVRLAGESFRRDLIAETIALMNHEDNTESNLYSNMDFMIKNGEIRSKQLPERAISLRKLGETLAAQGRSLRVKESFTAQTVKMDENGQGSPYWPYTFSAYGVEVAVDTLTGRVQCTKAWCVQDVGRAVNPTLCEGQVDGGFVMGLGYTLYEDLGVRDGRINNNRFSKYILPTAMDVPVINKFLIEDPENTAPYGAKGIGEPVMLPVAPAILNAIHNAAGVWIKELPATPEKVLAAIRKQSQNV